MYIRRIPYSNATVCPSKNVHRDNPPLFSNTYIYPCPKAPGRSLIYAKLSFFLFQWSRAFAIYIEECSSFWKKTKSKWLYELCWARIRKRFWVWACEYECGAQVTARIAAAPSSLCLFARVYHVYVCYEFALYIMQIRRGLTGFWFCFYSVNTYHWYCSYLYYVK